MTTLIMLCGQGSAGKSFFGTLLYQWLENSSFIRMDSYVDNSIGY
jgi:shikimate kinase